MKKSTYSRVTSLVLLVAMLLSMFPLTSFSTVREISAGNLEVPVFDEVISEDPSEPAELVNEDQVQTGALDDFTYQIINGSYVSITKYTGSGSAVIIPGTIDGYPVQAIASNAFYNNKDITSVFFPDSITDISSGAFAYCTKLSSINYPKNLKSAGISGPFAYCDSLATVTVPEGVTSIPSNTFYRCTGLTKVSLPDSITDLGGYAFGYCTNLSSINYPRNLKTASINAPFTHCDSLTTVTVPEGVTIIPSYTFYRCTGLTKVSLPDTITDLGAYAFGSCTNLININYPKNLKTASINGPFAYCSRLTTVTIPEGVTIVPSYTFFRCTGLTKVSFPDSITELGSYAFGNCTNLSNINYPKNLKTVNINGPFAYCSRLTTVTIPEGVTTIPSYTFRYCTGLSTMYFPNSLTSIGGDAFYSCSHLKNALFLGNAPTTFGNNVFNGTASGFTIFYLDTATGWTTPTWKGYPTIPIDEEGLNIPFHLSEINVQVTVGSSKTITVTPLIGMTFVTEPYVNVTKGKNPVDIEKVGDNTFEITIKGEVEEETEIEVFAACAKEAEGAPGVPVDVPDPDNRTIVANATNPGATVLITGKVFFHTPNDHGGWTDVVVKNHPVCIKDAKNPQKPIIGHGMTNDKGEIAVSLPASSEKVIFTVPLIYRSDGKYFDPVNNIYSISTGKIIQDSPYDHNNNNNNQAYRHTISLVETKESGGKREYPVISLEVWEKDIASLSTGVNDLILGLDGYEKFTILETLVEGRNLWTNSGSGEIAPLRVYCDKSESGYIEENKDPSKGTGWATERYKNGSVIRSIIYLSGSGLSEKRTYLHELGHCIMFNYSRQPDVADPHYAYGRYSNGVAYSEGWANFYAHAAYNGGLGESKIDYYDIETPRVTYGGDKYGPQQLRPRYGLEYEDSKEGKTMMRYNEYASAAIFWDIYNYYRKDLRMGNSGAISAIGTAMKETSKYSQRSGYPDMFEFYERITRDKVNVWEKAFKANFQGFMDAIPPDVIVWSEFDSNTGKYSIKVDATDDTKVERVDLFCGNHYNDSISYIGSSKSVPCSFNTIKGHDIYEHDLLVNTFIARVSDLAGADATKVSGNAIVYTDDAKKYDVDRGYEGKNGKGFMPFGEFTYSYRDTAPATYDLPLPSANDDIITLMQNKGLSARSITSEDDIDQDIYRYDVLLLNNEIKDKIDILKDYISNSGVLFVTAEAGNFLDNTFTDVFSTTIINSDAPLTTNDKGLMAVIGDSTLDGIILPTTAAGFKENPKLQAIASMGDAVICAAGDYGYGRIIYVPFSPDATSNQLLDYAIDTAATDNIRGRVKVSFHLRDHILQDSYPLTLEAGTSKTYSVPKGADDLYIANNQYVPELKLEVFSPDGSIYELEPEGMYSYMYDLDGEAGTWTVKISNEGDRTLTTALFVSQPIHEIYFDDLDIANDGYLYTNKRAFVLSGTADAYNSFSLTIEHEEDSVIRTVSIVNGEFSHNIQLEPGINKLEINAVDDAGNKLFRSLWVCYDTVAPVLEVASSQDIAYLDDYTLILSANESCIVTVNDEECEDISSGTPVYSFETALETGNNVFNVVATDYAGNRTTLRVTITRSEKTMEGNNPEIVGFSIRENAIISEDTAVYVFIQEESDYILRAWLDDKEMVVDGNMIDLNLKGIKSGRHSLICYVEDEWGNSTQVAISVIVEKEVEDGICVSGKIKSYNPNKPITIQLMKAENEIAYTETFEGSGGYGLEEQEFIIPDVAPGIYDLVIIKDAHTKLTVKNVTVSNEDLDLTKDIRPEVQLMTLRCGDINGDGLINDADLTILWRAGNYNRKADEAENSWCDLNGDGLINDADLTILWLAYNYNRGAIIIE